MSEIETGRIHATKVLAEEIKVGEKFIPGTNIVIPSVVKEPHLRAKVVMVGKGTVSVPVEEEIGDTIIFSPHSPQRLKLGDTDYLLLDTRDVLFRIPQVVS